MATRNGVWYPDEIYPGETSYIDESMPEATGIEPATQELPFGEMPTPPIPQEAAQPSQDVQNAMLAGAATGVQAPPQATPQEALTQGTRDALGVQAPEVPQDPYVNQPPPATDDAVTINPGQRGTTTEEQLEVSGQESTGAHKVGIDTTKGEAEATKVALDKNAYANYVKSEIQRQKNEQEALAFKEAQAKRAAAKAQSDANIEKIASRDVETVLPGGAGAKFGRFVAAFAAGFVNVKTGGKGNVVLEQLNRQLDRHIQEQVRKKKDELQTAREQGKSALDEITADLALKQKEYELRAGAKMGLVNRLQLDAAEAKSEAERQRILQGIAPILKSAGEDRERITMLIDNRAMRMKELELKEKALAMKARKGRGGGGRGKTVVADKAPGMKIYNPFNPSETIDGGTFGSITDTESGRALEKLVYGGFKIHMKDGRILDGYATSKEAASKQNEDIRFARQALGSGARLLELMKDADGGIAFNSWLETSKNAALLRSEWVQLAMDLKDKYGLGVLTGPDMDLIEAAAGKGPEALRTVLAEKLSLNHVKAVLENLQGSTKSKMKDQILMQANLDPTQADIVLTPMGTVTKDLREARDAEALKPAPPFDDMKTVLSTSTKKHADKQRTTIKSLRNEWDNFYVTSEDTNETEGDRPPSLYTAKQLQKLPGLVASFVARKDLDPVAKQEAVKLLNHMQKTRRNRAADSDDRFSLARRAEEAGELKKAGMDPKKVAARKAKEEKEKTVSGRIGKAFKSFQKGLTDKE